MEYSSPLGYNFKLKESLAREEERKNEKARQSLPNYISLNSEGAKPFPFEVNQRPGKRNSHFDGSFDSDHKNKWNSPNQSYRGRNTSSNSVSDYYHPSMVEDPWQEFIKKDAGS